MGRNIWRVRVTLSMDCRCEEFVDASPDPVRITRNVAPIPCRYRNPNTGQGYGTRPVPVFNPLFAPGNRGGQTLLGNGWMQMRLRIAVAGVIAFLISGGGHTLTAA